MSSTSRVEKEKGVFDSQAWQTVRQQGEEQLARLRDWIEKSPEQALAAAAATGLVLGWIMKRR